MPNAYPVPIQIILHSRLITRIKLILLEKNIELIFTGNTLKLTLKKLKRTFILYFFQHLNSKKPKQEPQTYLTLYC